MSETLSLINARLSEQFGAQPGDFRGEHVFTLAGEHITGACKILRDEFGFEMLSDETAVDYGPQQEPRFQVIYQLTSIAHGQRVCLKVPVSGINPCTPTVEGVYPNANWHEREIWDLFGIRFENHSDMRRILMPRDWEGHPLRKDYPLGYEEVQFTFNAEEIDQTKPYAKE